MNTLAWILGFIIIGFVFAVLFGRAARLGAESEALPPTVTQLADRMDALKATQTALMVEMIDELQERIADNRKVLAELYTVPNDPQVIRHRAMVHGDIMDDERVLHSLRGNRGERETAANLWEGSM